MIPATLALAALLAGAPTDTCRETFVLDSVEYRVPDRWCGGRLDSTLFPDPATLARLPDSFTWQDFRIYLSRAARDAFVAMARAALKDSIRLRVTSGYRSIDYQRVIIRRRLAEGQTMAQVLSFVAPPGYSEHHTGRAVDLAPFGVAFAETPAYRWLQQHAAQYDFVEPFPRDTTDDRPYEPWHWVYRPDEP